jgi:hypothetical protein
MLNEPGLHGTASASDALATITANTAQRTKTLASVLMKSPKQPCLWRLRRSNRAPVRRVLAGRIMALRAAPRQRIFPGTARSGASRY